MEQNIAIPTPSDQSLATEDERTIHDLQALNNAVKDVPTLSKNDACLLRTLCAQAHRVASLYAEPSTPAQDR